ncbi:hypothetical protein R1sor_013044 [Riccia sorocarpa]|uniref:Uncharacterized protein n=1 Tax=Riccia sorocarpa TaxID=122646 RepID=A0ABD3H8Z0_9MARC
MAVNDQGNAGSESLSQNPYEALNQAEANVDALDEVAGRDERSLLREVSQQAEDRGDEAAVDIVPSLTQAYDVNDSQPEIITVVTQEKNTEGDELTPGTSIIPYVAPDESGQKENDGNNLAKRRQTRFRLDEPEESPAVREEDVQICQMQMISSPKRDEGCNLDPGAHSTPAPVLEGIPEAGILNVLEDWALGPTVYVDKDRDGVGDLLPLGHIPLSALDPPMVNFSSYAGPPR